MMINLAEEEPHWIIGLLVGLAILSPIIMAAALAIVFV